VALPLAWHVVGKKLTLRLQDKDTLQKQLEIYTKMMKTCQVMYEGTDRVFDTLSNLVEGIRLEDTFNGDYRAAAASTIPTNKSTLRLSDLQTQNIPSTALNAWTSILLHQPQDYGRVLIGLDMSLSVGRQLRREDIPAFLQRSSTAVGSSIPCPVLQGGLLSAERLYTNFSMALQATGRQPSIVTGSQRTSREDGFEDPFAIGAEIIEFGDAHLPITLNNERKPSALVALNNAELDLFDKLLQGYVEAGTLSDICG
jgi:hypothetical protein